MADGESLPRGARRSARSGRPSAVRSLVRDRSPALGNPGFGARRGWRCWSRADPAVHYAFYEFADLAEAQAATGSEKIAPLIADFDRVWGNRVPRRREILEIVQER